jgi:hypothetical protein
MTFRTEVFFVKSRYVTKVYTTTYSIGDSVKINKIGEIVFSPQQDQFIFNPQFFGLSKVSSKTLQSIASKLMQMNKKYDEGQ